MPIQIGQRESDFSNPLGLLSDCHRRIERFLSVLSKVARGRRGVKLDTEESAAVERALTYFREAAPKHTHDEEDSLFPRIVHSREAVAIIDQLEMDHTTAGSAHDEVDNLGRRWLQNESLSDEPAARLIDLLDLLQALYARHIVIEDQELFPLAAKLLDREKLTEIGNEMAARRSPK